MTAADFSNLHLQYKAEQAEGEVPAVIEHDFPGGRMVDHYFVTPSPAFWADEGFQSLDGVSGILFLQQPNGAPWKILVHEPSMIKEVVFDFPEEEFRKMLADNAVNGTVASVAVTIAVLGSVVSVCSMLNCSGVNCWLVSWATTVR